LLWLCFGWGAMTADLIRQSLDKAIENMVKEAVSDYFKR
jgi:hypothetical protein